MASTELALTDQRLMGRTGLFRRRYLTLSHRQIQTVHIRRGLLGMIWNYGTVTIIGTDGRKVAFPGIVRPTLLKLEIDRMVEIALLGRALPRLDEPAPPVSPKPHRPEIEAAIAMPPKSPARSSDYKDPTFW